MATFKPEVFTRDKRRCVYCGRDLVHDFDSFWSTQMDHLTPAAHGGSDDIENIVTACFVCNSLKHNFPPKGNSREERIASARQHIMKRRADKISEFCSWV